jgi:hypothetical protein
VEGMYPGQAAPVVPAAKVDSTSTFRLRRLAGLWA